MTISGRGTVVTGTVERGRVSAGETVDAVGFGLDRSAVIVSLETFGKTLEVSGDNCAALLRGVKRDEIVRGQALAAPGSTRAATEFTAQVYVLRASEGGRHTPFPNGYRRYFGATSVSSSVRLPNGAAPAARGDNLELTIITDKPVPFNVGAGFTLREGGRTVAAGTVLTVA